MRVKPKPCPNCGSKYVEMWTKFFGGNGFEVRCLDCGYIGELGKQEPQPRERGITTKGERRMQDYKLKPCPFCGRSPDVYQAPNMMILMGMPYFAGEWICLCLHCQMSAVGGKKYSDVVQKWNRRAPGWVSVDKVLPLNRTHVIGFDIESGWNYPSLCFCPDTKEFLDETYDYKPVSITHWMPYPEAPKEDEEDE